MTSLRPIVWLNVVGLTPRLLEHAPRLKALGAAGCAKPLGGIVPAVTCAAQATALTGLAPSGHGIVGNGWFQRDTGEVRFWLQSNRLVQGETVYAAARARAQALGVPFTCAKLFWWFNQGAPVDWSVTPKPWYGADGSKAFGIHSDPPGLCAELEGQLGDFPFHSFWGPMSGLPSSEWIARAAARVLETKRPTLTLVYLPHLDYDLQRLGPDDPGTPARVAEVDAAAGVVIDAARATGADVIAFSEYGLLPVRRHVLPNRVLRAAGLLEVRDGPYGETIDTYRSRAFVVCDHQIAHVYVRESQDHERVAALFEAEPAVARVLDQRAKVAMGLEHPRAGDLVLLSRPDAWFAYPYWLDERRAPDFARTVDIHRKPGYDPCELLFDPALRMPKLRVARRLLAKVLGFRYRMDVVPLDPSLVRGSHGLLPLDGRDGPVLVCDERSASHAVSTLADLKGYTLQRLGL
ncbi:MAG: alkaline phosphatase family protein [Planctomycetota bacterium]|nr:alkaline phosphatase family protein [Planctomycetota bacterium]